MEYPEKLVCITGAAQSEVGRPSPKSGLALTMDACLGAIESAGLKVADIDGISTYPGIVANGDGFSPVGSTDAMLALGLTPAWAASSNDGHMQMGAIVNAVHAIAAGKCRHVLVFRTLTQASARAEAPTAGIIGGGRSIPARIWGGQSWLLPFNALSAATQNALYAKRYFQKYGATSRQLGAIAVNSRRNAALNPNAIYKKPITIEDYLESRMISDPLRLYDCDTHIDGSTALILSHRDAAKDLRNPPIRIEALGASVSGMSSGRHNGDFSSLPADQAAQRMWSHTDLKPHNLDFAQVYDGFSILTLLWMEAAGLCGRGEAAAFVEGGTRIALEGELPINTGGGQLSAGRFHGYGHSYEACVQLWGLGGARQLARARTGLVCNGGFGYGCMVLTTD